MFGKLEYHYCKTCDKLFKTTVNISYYTLNHWIENQWQLIKKTDSTNEYNNTPVKHHDLIVPIRIINCPFCRSIHNINVKKILDRFTVYTKTGKPIPFNRLYSMKQYNRYAKIHKRIILKIGQEHLNIINDK